jgi:DNA-binding CsgD family transcriptional regulator
MVKVDGIKEPLNYHFSNYPTAWKSYYVENKFLFVDPVVKRACETVSPFAWDGLTAEKANGASNHFFNLAAEYGVKNGFSIPIHGPNDLALFSVCANELSATESHRLLRLTMPYLTVAALSIHERARAIFQPEALTVAGVKLLNPRETEVMQWVACGKSSWDISCILGLSESAIRHCVTNALRKLNCNDRTQGAIRAVLLGLIEAPG